MAVELGGHVKEAKSRFIRCILVFFGMFLAVWSQADTILTHLLSMTDLKIITVSPFEAITSKLYICTFIALVISLPYIVAEAYHFVSPGLYKQEKRMIQISTVSFYAVFVLGGVVSTEYVISPMLEMFAQYYITGIEQSVTLQSYVSLVISAFITVGAICCIPNITGVLTYCKIVTSQMMRKYRKHFVVGSLIFSAMVTPGTDVLSLVLLEVPVLILYEFSILISLAIETTRVKNNIKM